MALNFLTARKVETVAPKDKPYWLKDGGSLFLYVTPAGARLWRYRYRIGKTASVYSIGQYPTIGLEEARRERDRASELVRQGIHPLTDKKLKLSLQLDRNDNTFESAARNWMKSNTTWTENYRKQISSRRILMQDWADIWDMFAKGSNMEDVTVAFGPLSEKRTRLLSVVEREQ